MADETGVRRALTAAQTALARGDGIAAEAELARALAAGATRPQVAAWMGRAKLLQGDGTAARHWLADGRFVRSMQGEGFRALGELELAEGNLEASAMAYDRALAMLGGDAGLWVDIGRMRYRGGEQDKAIAAAQKALRLDPTNVRALEFRGQLLRDSKGLLAALPYFARGLKTAPDDLSLLAEYAGTQGELGRGKAFLVTTRRMIELDERDPRPFFQQAVLAARAGNDDLSGRLLWRTGGKLDHTASARLLRGVLDLQAGNYASASEAFDDLARAQPDNARVRLLLARTLAGDGAHRELIGRFAPLADRADASPYLLTLVGRAYEALGDRAAAARFLDRAAGPLPRGMVPTGEWTSLEVLHARWISDPDLIRNAIAYSRALLAHGRHSEAITVADRLRGRFPGAADLQLLAADARLLAGDQAGALSLYRQAASIRLSRPLARRMVVAHLALNQQAAARDLLRDYAEQHPRDGEIAALLAEEALARRDWARANGLLEHALRQGGGERDPRLLSALSVARLGLGDVAGAHRIARNAYLLQRMNAHGALVLGQVLAVMPGHQAEARLMLDKAVRMGLVG